MPNNPVQIILNHEDFLRAPEPGRFGPEKDFFEGRDEAFAAHQAALGAAVDRVAAEIQRAGYGPAAYLRVQMRTVEQDLGHYATPSYAPHSPPAPPATKKHAYVHTGLNSPLSRLTKPPRN